MARSLVFAGRLSQRLICYLFLCIEQQTYEQCYLAKKRDIGNRRCTPWKSHANRKKDYRKKHLISHPLLSTVLPDKTPLNHLSLIFFSRMGINQFDFFLKKNKLHFMTKHYIEPENIPQIKCCLSMPRKFIPVYEIDTFQYQ